jgi:hypothetical protein
MAAVSVAMLPLAHTNVNPLLFVMLHVTIQVAKAAYDATTHKWLLEGAVRSPARTLTDLKQQPPVTPWNLGVFDGLVLADKMAGCTGEARCRHITRTFLFRWVVA